MLWEEYFLSYYGWLVFSESGRLQDFQKLLYIILILSRRSLGYRACGRAIDLGGPNVYQGDQRLKFSTKTAVFKRVSLLVGGGASLSIGETRPPWPPLNAGPAGIDNVFVLRING